VSETTVRADLCDHGECARLRARVEELEAQLATARDDTGWAEELETLANDLPADCYPEEAGVLLGAADRLRMVAAENARLREALAHVGICPSCKGFGWVVLVHEVDGEVVREPRMCVSCEGRKLQTPAWHALGCPDCATVPTVEEFLAAEALGEVRDDER